MNDIVKEVEDKEIDLFLLQILVACDGAERVKNDLENTEKFFGNSFNIPPTFYGK